MQLSNSRDEFTVNLHVMHPPTPRCCSPVRLALRDGHARQSGQHAKMEPPFPNMKDMFKKYAKKVINDAVSLINAPRRTVTYVLSAWNVLLFAPDLASLLTDKRLLAARAEVNAEVERCTHTSPMRCPGSIVRHSVHPVVATRWAGHLNSSKPEIILVANEGYLPRLANFPCWIPSWPGSASRP